MVTEIQRLPGTFNITDPAWPKYVAMQPYASDQFTGGNASTLIGRLTDAGLGGNQLPWVGLDRAMAISSGRGVRGDSSGSNWFNGVAESIADTEISFVMHTPPSIIGNLWVDVRRSSSSGAGTPDGARLSVGPSTIQLQQRKDNTQQVLSDPMPYGAGDVITLRAFGARLEAYVNGLLVASAETTVLAAGFSGFAGVSSAPSWAVDDVVFGRSVF